MLRKTFRHYDIDNIIVTVSRGMLQLNQDLSIELLDAGPALTEGANPPQRLLKPSLRRRQRPPIATCARNVLVSGRRLSADHRPAAGGIHFCRYPSPDRSI